MKSDDAFLHLIGMMGMGTEKYIETQEKQGQNEVSFGSKFPIDVRGLSKQEMESMGFVFGKKIDELFQEVVLPAGWRIQPTDHSMWSNILDENGDNRGDMFYKAAFYDRCAFASMKK